MTRKCFHTYIACTALGHIKFAVLAACLSASRTTAPGRVGWAVGLSCRRRFVPGGDRGTSPSRRGCGAQETVRCFDCRLQAQSVGDVSAVMSLHCLGLLDAMTGDGKRRELATRHADADLRPGRPPAAGLRGPAGNAAGGHPTQGADRLVRRRGATSDPLAARAAASHCHLCARLLRGQSTTQEPVPTACDC
jgi:hypothetical protein